VCGAWKVVRSSRSTVVLARFKTMGAMGNLYRESDLAPPRPHTLAAGAEYDDLHSVHEQRESTRLRACILCPTGPAKQDRF
jgi:hypothetical protein